MAVEELATGGGGAGRVGGRSHDLERAAKEVELTLPRGLGAEYSTEQRPGLWSFR
jgi:hypothetical protein